MWGGGGRMAQCKHLKRGAHFGHFANFVNVEGGNAYAAPRFGNGEALCLQPPEGFTHRHMAGLEFLGNMILAQFGAGLDLARNDTIRENAADAGGNCFAPGSGPGGWDILIHGFIDNVLCPGGRAILILLTAYTVKLCFCWTNEAQFLITPPFCTESAAAEECRPVSIHA